MAYANAKGEINFREIARKQFVKHFAHHSKAVHALSFIPDSTRLLAGADDFNLSVCDFVSGRVVHIYKKLHSDFVRCVEPFAQNSNLVISGSYDKTVRIYDIREPAQSHKHLMEHGAEVEDMQIYNTDLSLVTVGGKLV
jgi:U3 small nucleolar RNA-associated protein 15